MERRSPDRRVAEVIRIEPIRRSAFLRQPQTEEFCAGRVGDKVETVHDLPGSVTFGTLCKVCRLLHRTQSVLDAASFSLNMAHFAKYAAPPLERMLMRLHFQ